MTAHRPWAGLLLALALVAAACSSDGFDPDVEAADEPSADSTATASPEPTEVPSGDRVPIISGTVSDLVDRRDLTLTVGDLTSPLDAVVPDLVGLELDEAVVLLDEAGFVPYLADTFPPEGEVDVVVDTWPVAGDTFLEGANVFLELDGPTDAVLVAAGDELAGVVNGVQFLAFDRFENWLLRVWLDDPIGVETDDDPITVGREVELRVGPEDVACTSGETIADPTILPPGGAIGFTLTDDSTQDLRFAIPPRLTVADVTVDCG